MALFRAAAVLALALAAGACTDDDGAKRIDVGGDNEPPAQTVSPDAGTAPGTAPAACVERPPGAAPSAPAGGALPCELISPGFVSR